MVGHAHPTPLFARPILGADHHEGPAVAAAHFQGFVVSQYLLDVFAKLPYNITHKPLDVHLHWHANVEHGPANQVHRVAGG